MFSQVDPDQKTRSGGGLDIRSGQQCMIVALSGWGQDEDRQKSEAAGFERHVVKPIGRATLEWIVMQEKE